MTDTMTTTAPERIWLQIDPSGDPNDRSEPCPDPAGVELTWCWTQVGGQEVEYVRADLVGALSHAEGEAVPDNVLDVLDNLVHDNYERSYRGAQNRQDDAELIRCALRRSHPAPQVAVPEGWRHALEEALAMMTSQSMTLERQADAVTGIRDLLAAAPTEWRGPEDGGIDRSIAPSRPIGTFAKRLRNGERTMNKTEYRLFVEREICKSLGMRTDVIYWDMGPLIIGYMYGALNEPHPRTMWNRASRAADLMMGLSKLENSRP